MFFKYSILRNPHAKYIPTSKLDLSSTRCNLIVVIATTNSSTNNKKRILINHRLYIDNLNFR